MFYRICSVNAAKRRFFSLFVFVLLLFCLSALSTAEGYDDGASLRFESLYPAAYDDFKLAICTDQLGANSIKYDSISDDGRVCYFQLSEAEARELFNDSTPLSIGPGQSILWFNTYSRSLMVQHGSTLVPLLVANNRGATDSKGSLVDTMNYITRLSPYVISGYCRWSPDERYIFIYDKDKWYRAAKHDEPFLIDTFTGEIFLLETEPVTNTLQPNLNEYILCGRFSEYDETFFYLLQESGEDGRGLLKRYNLTSDEIETVYSTESQIIDFCSYGQDRWLVLERGENDCYLVNLCCDGEISIEKQAFYNPFDASGLSMYPIGDGIIMICGMSQAYFTPFVYVDTKASISQGAWCVISGAEELAVTQMETGKEIDAVLLWESLANFRWVKNTAVVNSVSVMDNSSMVLMSAEIIREVPNSWDGMYEKVYGIILLDTITGEIIPVYSNADNGIFLLDEYLPADKFLMRYGWNNEFCILSGTDRKLDIYNVVQSEEALKTNRTYTCTLGTYSVADNDGVIIMSPSNVRTDNLKIQAYSDIVEDKTFCTLMFSEYSDPMLYMIPEAISRERFNGFMENLSSATKKKIASNYQLIEPDKLMTREDATDLIKRYPGIKKKAMYVIREIPSQENKQKLVKYFAEAGYTADDYIEDLGNVKFSVLGSTLFEVRYLWRSTHEFSSARILKTAELLDQIGCVVYENCYSGLMADSYSDVSTESTIYSILESRSNVRYELSFILDLLHDSYVVDGVSFRLSDVSIQSEGKDITLQFSVVLDSIE